MIYVSILFIFLYFLRGITALLCYKPTWMPKCFAFLSRYKLISLASTLLELRTIRFA